MSAAMNYGDITPAIAAYAVVRMLKRAMPLLHIEKFGQTYALPKNNTNTAKFRRYFLAGATGSAGLTGNPISNFNIPTATTPLVEGVTPTGSKLAVEDYTVRLYQYGDWIPLTDVIQDIHTDNILNNCTEILGEQAAVTLETIRFNVLKAGVNVFYANGVAGRSTIAKTVSRADQRRITTALNRQNAKKITSVVGSSTDFNTKSIAPSYIAIAHPDLEGDLRNLEGFVDVANYGPHTSPMEGELGFCEQVRYLLSTVFLPWSGTGVATGTAPTLRHSDAGTGDKVDVYPVLYFARDAYGLVPLKGASSMTPMVVNPKPASGDPLGQRGSVGWKLWTGIVILQEAFMARLECGATA